MWDDTSAALTIASTVNRELVNASSVKRAYGAAALDGLINAACQTTEIESVCETTPTHPTAVSAWRGFTRYFVCESGTVRRAAAHRATGEGMTTTYAVRKVYLTNNLGDPIRWLEISVTPLVAYPNAYITGTHNIPVWNTVARGMNDWLTSPVEP